MKNDKTTLVMSKMILAAVTAMMALMVAVSASALPSTQAASVVHGRAPEAAQVSEARTVQAFSTSERPKTTIAIQAAPKASPVQKAWKAPCRTRDEGSRGLIQGSGTVRTVSFCH